jgi:hypothetical protein
MWVCRQVEQGRSRDSIVYELRHGEGLMPSSYNAPIIYDAATWGAELSERDDKQ